MDDDFLRKPTGRVDVIPQPPYFIRRMAHLECGHVQEIMGGYPHKRYAPPTRRVRCSHCERTAEGSEVERECWRAAGARLLAERYGCPAAAVLAAEWDWRGPPDDYQLGHAHGACEWPEVGPVAASLAEALGGQLDDDGWGTRQIHLGHRHHASVSPPEHEDHRRPGVRVRLVVMSCGGDLPDGVGHLEGTEEFGLGEAGRAASWALAWWRDQGWPLHEAEVARYERETGFRSAL